MASGVGGISPLRRLLRRLPDDITKEVKDEVKLGAAQVLAAQRAGAPAASIRSNLSIKQNRDGLSASIGLNGKRANKKGFLARIFEGGAKAHEIVAGTRSKRAKRRRGGGGGGTPRIVLVTGGGEFLGKSVRVAMRKRPFFFPPWRARRDGIKRKILESVSRVLRSA